MESVWKKYCCYFREQVAIYGMNDVVWKRMIVNEPNATNKYKKYTVISLINIQ